MIQKWHETEASETGSLDGERMTGNEGVENR
jgi:hypothetical protein